MRYSIRILVAVCVAATMFVPATGAQASHTCDTKDIYIFSGIDATAVSAGYVNSNAARCAVGSDGEDVYDGRIINPASNSFYVRYAQDLGDDFDVVVTLQGLGYNGEQFPAPRQQHILGGFNHETRRLPLDPTASGTITATITIDGQELGSRTYRTIDA